MNGTVNFKWKLRTRKPYAPRLYILSFDISSAVSGARVGMQRFTAKLGHEFLARSKIKMSLAKELLPITEYRLY